MLDDFLRKEYEFIKRSCSDRCWGCAALVSRVCPGEDIELLLLRGGEAVLAFDWARSRMGDLSRFKE
jgi:hypothetical protein